MMGEKTRSQFAAVIFDKDGTLFDTESVFRSVAREQAGQLGYLITDEVHDRFIGGTVDNTRKVLLEVFGVAFPFDIFHEGCRARMNAHHEAAVPMRSGAMSVLQHLVDRGIPLALATSARRPETWQNLTAAGLIGHFKTIVTRDDVTFPKPHPEPYLLAARRLGVPPDRCLAVEDSVTGATSALAAGMKTFLIPDHARTVTTSIPDAIVLSDLAALLTAVAKLTFSNGLTT